MLIDHRNWNATEEKLAEYRHLFENKPFEWFFPLFVRMVDERRAIFLTIVPSPILCILGKKNCSLLRIIPNKVASRLFPQDSSRLPRFRGTTSDNKDNRQLPVFFQDWYSRGSSKRARDKSRKDCEEERKKRGLFSSREGAVVSIRRWQLVIGSIWKENKDVEKEEGGLIEIKSLKISIIEFLIEEILTEFFHYEYFVTIEYFFFDRIRCLISLSFFFFLKRACRSHTLSRQISYLRVSLAAIFAKNVPILVYRLCNMHGAQSASNLLLW